LKTTVTLVYPYFHTRRDNSIFRFPPLGLGYIAAYLKQHGFSVKIVDCTFISQKEALRQIRNSNPKIIGIQSMFSLREKSLEMARLLRKNCELLVAGGPLPTTNSEVFLNDFDVVVNGEGEQTMLELVKAFEKGVDFSQVSGITYKDAKSGETRRTVKRATISNLDAVPFPSRALFDNSAYKRYYLRKFGYSITTIMTSRGCPYTCDFCSRPVFGKEFRNRTATNIVDEIEEVISLGYERVWFADDCFTLKRQRLIEVCDEIVNRKLKIGWECLSRVDTLDSELVRRMKQAGCLRIFFGIESGDDSILAIMGKNTTAKKAEEAVRLCNSEGVKVGAFFIIGYPGETEKTLLNTIKFASSLQLDYLSFTLPFPIPGTPLFERLKSDIITDEYTEPNQLPLLTQKLMFRSRLSEPKLKFAIVKGMTEFYIQKYLAKHMRRLIIPPFELFTDVVYKLMR
jgi:anaerobic magnesium-protoporphyrin IX monomethyl ester cyclase